MSAIPDGFGPPPDIPGGVPILGQQAPQMPRRTKTTVEFHSSVAGIYAVLDDDNVCVQYKLRIIDPIFNIEYHMDFMQDMKDALKDQINEMPDVGEKVEEEEAQADA